MKHLLRTVLLLPLFSLPAMAGMVSLANPATIRVYSGGQLIYQGVVDGNITTSDNSSLYVFQDRCAIGSDKTVAVAGEIVVTQDKAVCPAREK